MPRNTVSPLTIKKRLIVCFCFFILIVIGLIGRLSWVQLVKAEEYRQLAWDQWNRSIPSRSPRGTIFDSQGRILAGSATAETIVAFPPQIVDPEATAEELAGVLEMDYDKVLSLLNSQLASIFIKRQVDDETALKVRELGLKGIGFAQESKRYYPNDKLLSQVLGFVGVDQGWSGLELKYEELLKGRDGRIVFQADGRGRRIPQGSQHFIPPVYGANLQLTIDEYIQFIVERELDRAMIEYQPLRAIALAVNPMTGEILAMAGKPDFDPNDYAAYLQEYWNISPISNTFEPGSTFKLVTLSAAIEEGKYNMNESFYCSGSVKVAGHNIHCWTGNGHGAIDYLEVVYGSCNPGFISLGQRLGKETLQKYIDAFGFGIKTGIDLPGESTGIIFEPEDMGPVELATTSFGQGVSVTPIQQIMAIAAMVNGGTLYEPYLVKEVTDADGNTVEKKSPTAVRQVISKETSDQVRHIMEQVVIQGTARNAAIPGYRIGGKTGTAQKVGPGGHYIAGEYIVSFVGFLPLENPQILLYVAVDGAKKGIQWGSQISAPIGKRIFKDIITYLSIPPDSEEENDSFKDLVTVPNIEGLNLRQAGSAVDSIGLVIRTVGEGKVIENQTPKAGAKVPLQTDVLAYLGKNGEEEVEIPNFSGWTMRQAAEALSWLGLNMESTGSGVVSSQDPTPGEKAQPGDTVILEFGAAD